MVKCNNIGPEKVYILTGGLAWVAGKIEHRKANHELPHSCYTSSIKLSLSPQAAKAI